MNIRTGVDFSCVFQFARKIRYNYYLRNRVERRKNKELLKRAREGSRDNVKNKEPLVSVLIPTYNRGRILVERTVSSILKQTYQNFEVIIVGDHCTDNTEELIKNTNDKRITFHNLPKRGEYPANLHNRWMVAGTVPANKAIQISSGDWLAPLDDDDEFSQDHIEVLLNYALEHDYEMVYGKVEREIEPNKWVELGSYPPKCARISHLSVLYHSRLKFLRYDINAWKYREGADWNRWRRMKEAGVKIGFVNKVVGKHYLEGTQRGA